MMARMTMLLLALVAAPGAQVRERDDGWRAPFDAAAKLNPLASRNETLSGGRKLYRQRCATCHSDDGRGSSKAPDLTQAAVQEQSDGALFWKISTGNTREGMPSFSFLPTLQRWQLVQTVRAAASR
jgi:mono/diheme cytochrome c family protein